MRLLLFSSGGIQMAPIPEPEHIHFILKWWQEFLAGTIMIFLGLYTRSKGKEKEESMIIPLSEEHIDNKMEICKLQIMNSIQKLLESHEEKMIKRMKEIFKK